MIIDGNKFKNYEDIPHKTVIKGDAKYLNIAAASILAKHARDNYMQKISKKFPNYHWFKNNGYPTKFWYNNFKSQFRLNQPFVQLLACLPILKVPPVPVSDVRFSSTRIPPRVRKIW